MSKKSIKLVSALLTVALVVMMLTTTAFAAADVSGSSGIFGELEGDATIKGSGNLIEAGNKIVSTIRIVGMIIAVIIIMVLGIKYMMGSSEEKASYKKTMMPYLIGAILLFGASALAEAVFSFANDL